MTTIVATRAAMFADSKVTDECTSYPTTKVCRIRDALVGCSGDGPAIGAFLRWFEGDRTQPLELPPDMMVRALVLAPDGIRIYANSDYPDIIERDHHAIGSGAHAALGAMMAGASPERAVEIACTVDNDTGFPVRMYLL